MQEQKDIETEKDIELKALVKRTHELMRGRRGSKNGDSKPIEDGDSTVITQN